jgi:hypothetical protein
VTARALARAVGAQEGPAYVNDHLLRNRLLLQYCTTGTAPVVVALAQTDDHRRTRISTCVMPYTVTVLVPYPLSLRQVIPMEDPFAIVERPAFIFV